MLMKENLELHSLPEAFPAGMSQPLILPGPGSLWSQRRESAPNQVIPGKKKNPKTPNPKLAWLFPKSSRERKGRA